MLETEAAAEASAGLGRHEDVSRCCFFAEVGMAASRVAQGDSIDEMIRLAESKVISTTPGNVPPHLDDGGHLPFGGSLGGTRGKSLFGKRKIVTADGDPNPQALLLNFPPRASAENIRVWERNYRSNMYEDPTAEAVRFQSTYHLAFGPPDAPSCLAEAHRSFGNLRQTANTRPCPSPAYYPVERPGVVVPPEKCDYEWHWPERKVRSPPAMIKRPEAVTFTDFLQEYDLRPPWLKY